MVKTSKDETEKPQFALLWQLKNYNKVFAHHSVGVQAGKTTTQTHN